jgi:hypothetical protein
MSKGISVRREGLPRNIYVLRTMVDEQRYVRHLHKNFRFEFSVFRLEPHTCNHRQPLTSYVPLKFSKDDCFLTVLPRLAVDEIFITGIQVAEETGTGSELGS